MKCYLLDTNIVSLALRGGAPGVADRLAKLRRDQVGTSVVTLMELRYGATLPGRAASFHEVIDRFVSAMHVHPLTAESARVYGELRADLRAKGTPIGPFDTLIGAHALALGATVVTNNVREFERGRASQSRIAVEDWSRA